MTRTLNVWWDERLVGQLKQNQHGELGFSYAQDWLDEAKSPPLSASLQKTPRTIQSARMPPILRRPPAVRKPTGSSGTDIGGFTRR